MFKGDLDELKELQNNADQKYDGISSKVRGNVKSILGKYDLQPMHTEEISFTDSWIKVNISGINKYPMPNEVIIEITERMDSKKSSMQTKDDKLELTFNY